METATLLNKKHTSYPFSKGPLLYSVSDINKKHKPGEWMLPVKTAKVFYVNYALLMHDFPQLSEKNLLKSLPYSKELPEAEKIKAIENIIDKWLIKHSAFISQKQASQARVNTPIYTGTKRSRGFRPPNYGRAVVFSIEKHLEVLGVSEDLGESPTDKGLIDVKGVGVSMHREPKFGDHHNGLLGLHEGVKELIFEQIIHGIFKREKSPHKTLPVYALIDLGFDIVMKRFENKNGKRKLAEQGNRRAGLLLRRAHNRPPGGGDLPTYNSPAQIAKINIELMLRKYGITSANNATSIFVTPEKEGYKVKYASEVIPIPKGPIHDTFLKVSRYQGQPLTFDGINIQITSDLAVDPLATIVVDFGHYHVKKKFTDPILSLVVDRVLRWGGAIWPQDHLYVQPDSSIQIPYKLWGGKGPVWGFRDSLVQQKTFSFSMGLCNKYVAGIITPNEVMEYVEKYLGTAFLKWK